jgi:hypothetical protein
MKKPFQWLLGVVLGLFTLQLHGAYNAPIQSPPAPQVSPVDQRNMQLSAEAANRWLALVDQGKYGESWDTASNIMRFTIKRDEWIKAQEKLRGPLGNVISRTIVEQSPAKDPKGLPAGDYMVLAYKTKFTNRPSAYELVTMVLSTDGLWKVLTYQGSIAN